MWSGDFRKRRSTILVWTTKISSDVSTYYAQPLTHAYKAAKYSEKKNLGVQTYLHSLVSKRCESVSVNANLVIRFRD